MAGTLERRQLFFQIFCLSNAKCAERVDRTNRLAAKVGREVQQEESKKLICFKIERLQKTWCDSNADQSSGCALDLEKDGAEQSVLYIASAASLDLRTGHTCCPFLFSSFMVAIYDHSSARHGMESVLVGFVRDPYRSKVFTREL